MYVFALHFEGEAVGESETYQSKLSPTYRDKAASENHRDLIQKLFTTVHHILAQILPGSINSLATVM